MATVNPTFQYYGDDFVVVKWVLTSTDSDGAPLGPNFVNFADRTVQVTGTIGTASGLMLQGSNDGTNYDSAGLSDQFGTNLTAMTVNSLWSVAELPLFTRPILTTPGSGATLTFILTARKARSGLARGG